MPIEVRSSIRVVAPDPTALKTEVEKFIKLRSSDGTWSRQTTRVHGAALQEFYAELGEDTRLAQISVTIARAYYAKLQGRLKESGAQIRVRALKTFFNIHIQNTETFTIKDRENRPVPLTADFQKFLVGYLEGKDKQDFALRPQTKYGRGTYRYDFIRPFSECTAAQGLKWVGPHVMRKTFASLLVQAGMNIYKVARWIGDEVSTAQKHYAHLEPQDTEIERMM